VAHAEECLAKSDEREQNMRLKLADSYKAQIESLNDKVVRKNRDLQEKAKEVMSLQTELD